MLLSVDLLFPTLEAAEPYKIIVDEKGNIVSEESISSATGGTQIVQNSRASGINGISIGSEADAKGDYAAAIGPDNIASGTGSIAFGNRNYAGIKPETTENGDLYFRYKTDIGTFCAALDGSKIYTSSDGKPVFYDDRPVLIGKDGNLYVPQREGANGASGSSKYNSNLRYQKYFAKAVIDENGVIHLQGKVTSLNLPGNVIDPFELPPTSFETVHGELVTDNLTEAAGALAFGRNSLAAGNYSLAFGRGSQSFGEGATAFGELTVAKGEDAVAWGNSSTAGPYQVQYISRELPSYWMNEGIAFSKAPDGNAGRGSIYVDSNGVRLLTDMYGVPLLYDGKCIPIATDGNGYITKKVSGKGNQNFKVTVDTYGSLSIANTPTEGTITYQPAEGNFAFASNNTAFGNGTEAHADNATAWGYRTAAIGENATVWGSWTVASDTDATAWGYESRAFGSQATAWGNWTLAYGDSATAWGEDGKAYGDKSTVWGDSATAGYKITNFSNGISAYTKSYGNQDFYVNEDGTLLLTDAQGIPVVYNGEPILVRKDGSGYISKYVKGKGNQFFKVTVNADGTLSIADNPTETLPDYQSVGGTFASTANSTAFGNETVAAGDQATAWGDGSYALGENATAWGYESKAYGENSTAFGNGSIADGDNSLAALGGKTGVEDADTKTFTGGSHAAAIGQDAWAKVDDSMALGSRSIADRAAGQGADYQQHSGYDVTTGKESIGTDSVWRSTESAIAVGNPKENVTRQITGVAAGYEDTDAVNVAQLKRVETLAAQPTIIQGSDNISVQGPTDSNGNKTYSINLKDNITLGKNETAVTVSGTEGQVIVGGDKGVKFGYIKDGDSSLTIYDKDGNATDKKAVAGKFVTNLDNKTWNEDGSYVSGRAATEDQLHQVESNIDNKINNINATINRAVNQHSTVSVNGNEGKGNLILKKTNTTENAGDNYDISLSNDVTFGSTGDNGNDGKMTVISQDGMKSITANGKKGTLTFQNGQSEVVLQAGSAVKGIDNITDIKRVTADGHTVATMDDGMKYGDDFGSTAKVKLNHQLDIVGDINVGRQNGNKATKDDLSDGNIGIIATDTTYNDDGTVKENGRMTVKLAKDLKGLSSFTINGDDHHDAITIQQGNVNMGGNKIEGVAPGKIAPDSTDAVNGSQLYATNQNISNLGGEVNKLGTRVNRVGANAAALGALHPLDFDPDDKWDFAAGYGNYKNANAAAIGAYYRPNEDTMFSVGGSFGGGENMLNAGISVKLGQDNHVSTSRVAMAKEIKDLRKDVDDLKAVVNQQSALIDKLTGVNAGQLSGSDELFPDVPSNHWAYEYVTKLRQAGILTGYPDGNFAGDRMMTRYEFAAIVYRAIMAGAAANPNLNRDGTLDRLAKEFSGEMKYIRIDTIRKDRNGKPTIQRVRVIKEEEVK